jgi:hypothetical protein
MTAYFPISVAAAKYFDGTEALFSSFATLVNTVMSSEIPSEKLAEAKDKVAKELKSASVPSKYLGRCLTLPGVFHRSLSDQIRNSG